MSGTLPLSVRIEAILFYKGEPVSVKELARLLKVSEGEIQDGLKELERTLEGRGIQLLINGNDITLGTTRVMGPLIEELIKEELNKELGKAGLETLAIVLYRGPVARSEINYIRGVNSNYILRSLQVRGLIEKDETSSARSIVYRPTFELLSYLGISRVEELPEYEASRTAVETFEQKTKEDDNEAGE